MPMRPRSTAVKSMRKSEIIVELASEPVISRLSRRPAIAKPGRINAERRNQCPMNFGHAPGAPSKTPHTDAEDGAVGHVELTSLNVTRWRPGLLGSRERSTSMLAAYTSPAPPVFLRQSVERHIEQARAWLAASRQRASCDDAYSDLLLATERYGAARTFVAFVPDLQTRVQLIADVDALMADLLICSHELRVACRAPIAR